MKTSLFLRFSLALCCLFLSGCGKRGLVNLYARKNDQFVCSTSIGKAQVYARLCSHKEIRSYFSHYEDLHHYYHLIHLRVDNSSFMRYSFYADDQAFFVPPSVVLRKYTQSSAGSIGGIISWVTTLLLLPFYALNVVKGTVENPYLVDTGNDQTIIIPRHFALLTGLYTATSLTPLFLGMVLQKSKSNKYFNEANPLIVSQHEERLIAPYKNRDMLILTPRAGFHASCPLVLYNHHKKAREHGVLDFTL